ncbi:MAG: hypothetical protein MZV70_01060 [Desulfobacterales bacterium]|nr:hypothetical protein [Desulfobacterales bacterium]
MNCPIITVNPATILHGSSGAAYSQTFTRDGRDTAGSRTASQERCRTAQPSLAIPCLELRRKVGTFPITITASDASGCSGSRSYTLIINRTVIVTTTVDSGPGSLRQAIVDALSGDTIAFDPTLNGQTITLTSGELVIGEDLTINGPDTDGVTVSGGRRPRVPQ